MAEEIKSLAEALMHYADVQAEWLGDHYPTISDDQFHLDDGSVARGYWHYGYMTALRDVLAAMHPTEKVN